MLAAPVGVGRGGTAGRGAAVTGTAAGAGMRAFRLVTEAGMKAAAAPGMAEDFWHQKDLGAN